MKKSFKAGLLLIIGCLIVTSVALGQIRDHQTKRSDYSGQIIKTTEEPSEGANLGNLFNMKMSHSYSVNLGTGLGGQMYNMNAYTNTMQFFFNEKLTGEVNISLLHSPFGQSSAYGISNEQQMNVALNAEIDYQINDKMNLHFEVNRYPSGYGLGRGYGMYRNSMFRSGSIFDHQ